MSAMRSTRGIGISLALLLLLLAAGCGGGGEQEREQGTVTDSAESTESPGPDALAYSDARALDEPAAREAAFLEFLAGFPESNRRDGAIYYVWELKKEKDPSEARAWARNLLKTEPSDAGKGRLYRCLIMDAVAREDMDEALALAHEFDAAGLDAPRSANAVAWALVDDPGWDPDLGVALAEQAAEGAEGEEKAMYLDTAGWGNYKLGRHEMAAIQLEAAITALQEPDADVSEHLEAVYRAQNEADKLLALYTLQLEFRVDSRLQARAEALADSAGQDLGLFRAKLWEQRQQRATPAGDFTLKDLDGNAHRLSDYRGKVVLLNFWHPT